MFRGSGTEAVVSSTAYNVLDAAISSLNRRSKKQVQVQMGWSLRAAFAQLSSVPKCMNSFNGEILPRCAAEGLLVQCHNDKACGVHEDENEGEDEDEPKKDKGKGKAKEEETNEGRSPPAKRVRRIIFLLSFAY